MTNLIETYLTFSQFCKNVISTRMRMCVCVSARLAYTDRQANIYNVLDHFGHKITNKYHASVYT